MARWACRLLAIAALFGWARAADGSAALIEALEATNDEEKAKELLAPHMDKLKGLDTQVVEKVVMKQWWSLSRDIVANSHLQQVDLSFAVRKAVRQLKDEADELLRTLNPKYGQAQQVSPAFQWAQNDTCIFLTVKYTVRWNAPGALEATDIVVSMADNFFNFTGLGKHSNNKYNYTLGLALFDVIRPQPISWWSAASVGKLSVTLRKRWPRKWPRLLANKKTKIGNMHVWMEMQDKAADALNGFSTVSHSPITCAANEQKVYCPGTDTCKKAGDCSSCPGKETLDEAMNVCTGRPGEKASISFSDADMEEGKVSGAVKITKAKIEYDIDHYVVYFGKDANTRLDPPLDIPLGQTEPTGGDAFVQIPAKTALPESATHLLVFSRNSHGEFATPGSVALKDAVLPRGKPGGLSFEDEDGEKGEVSGKVKIQRAEDEGLLKHYALHWGRSATRKLSHIKNIDKPAEGKEVEHSFSKNTKIPDGATHLLVFAGNEFGDSTSGASLKFADNTKPCLGRGDADCVQGIMAEPDSDPEERRAKGSVTITAAKDEATVTEYALYWGRSACSEEGGQSGAKNGAIGSLMAGRTPVYPLDTRVPEGSTHILAFSKNKYGESTYCVSHSFEDSVGKKEL